MAVILSVLHQIERHLRLQLAILVQNISNREKHFFVAASELDVVTWQKK